MTNKSRLLQALQSMLGERSLGQWHFEGGGYVRIAVAGDVNTEEALEMVETLLRLKREELERRSRPRLERRIS